MALDSKSTSPSRTYVAVCNKGNFDGYYFRKFKLPETLKEVPVHAHCDAFVHEIIGCNGQSCLVNLDNLDLPDRQIHDPYSGRNDQQAAEWYFLNVLDSVACIQGCIAWEDFLDVKEFTGNNDWPSKWKEIK